MTKAEKFHKALVALCKRHGYTLESWGYSDGIEIHPISWGLHHVEHAKLPKEKGKGK